AAYFPDARRVAPIRGSVRRFWPFIDIIGCGSANQASLIAFALHGDSLTSSAAAQQFKQA
ncbi:hypothetical protein, partial [Prevotellamassilia timonensis]|uniref:hypothetical protein n=1 Tax=Prevotellamassilia timonensis TaxID=1852370 RepID=UPI003FD6D582